jgi:hypothetical protein
MNYDTMRLVATTLLWMALLCAVYVGLWVLIKPSPMIVHVHMKHAVEIEE